MKFKITDVDGTAFEIEEKKVAETPVKEEFKFKTKEDLVAEEEPKEEVKETEPEKVEEAKEENPVEVEESLTQEEIKSLKELIIRMPEILEILDKAKEPEMAGEKEEVKEEVDESKIPFTEETESLIDDSIEDDEFNDIKLHDSKRSFGSVERKYSTNDSDELIDEISNAWKKRYSNGGK